jgi:hypothetical protein
MELAAELLEVTTEAELDRFIGNLLQRAAGAVRNFARSDTGQALGGILKQAAGQALPVIGRAIGGAVSPSGGDVGARVGKAAGTLLGLELEGLSAEDREFEVARALVRFAQEACRHALNAPATAPPAAVARAAAATAARRYAPGLLPTLLAPAGGAQCAGAQPVPARPEAVGAASARAATSARQMSGRWIRQGDRVVIFGV